MLPNSPNQLSTLFVIIVITTAGVTLLATRLVALLATALAAIFTMFLAATVVPNRVSHHVQRLDGSKRIVTLDDQFASPRTLFGGLVSNDHAQA